MIDGFRRWARRLGQALRPGRGEADLTREIAAHLTLLEDDFRRQGFPAEAAHRAARQALGGVEQTKELHRTARSFAWFDDARRDVRLAVRSLRRTSGFAILAILTLAIGIGANTAIFTLMNAVLIKPLPIYDPAGLLVIGSTKGSGVTGGGQDGSFVVFSVDLYRHLRDLNAVADLAAVQSSEQIGVGVRLPNAGAPEPASARFVSGNYFRLLGVEAAAGRMLQPSDDAADAPPVAVVSYAYWRTRLDSNPAVVGSAVHVGSTAVTVVGVGRDGFFGERLEARPPQLWLPLASERLLEPDLDYMDAPDRHWLYLLARLRQDVPAAAAESRLTAGLREWLRSREGPDVGADRLDEIAHNSVDFTAGANGIVHMAREYGLMLRLSLGLAGLVLLIACANIANLLFARGIARGPEFAIRLALGASRGRLIRQSLAESLTLALAGGALALPLATAGARVMLALVFGGDARVPIVASPDARVLVFALAASGVSAIVFGLAPALRASDDLTPSMRSAGRSLAGSARVSRWGRGLVVAEIVLSLVVVATAAALSRSLTNLSEQRFGFEGDRTIVITVDPLHAGYRSDQLPALYRDLDTRLNALPGVRSAAFSTYSPFNGCCWAQHQREDDDVRTLIDRVSPRYFETIGTPLVAGRTFTDRDSATSSHVAVVSEAFVRRYIVGNPIGQRLGVSAGAPADREIVGVVADAKYEAARDDLPPMIFLPMLQVGDEGERKRNNDSIFAGTIEIRASGDADAATRAVRDTLTGIDPNLAMLHAGTLASDVDRSIGGDRAIAVLSTASGLLALLLTGIGLYGVTAYGVRRRTSEIGVRMALGASRGHVVRLIARGVLDQGAIALAIGVPATFLALRLLSTTLYGVGPIDARDLAIGIGVIVVCVGAAACVPALRASRLNPVVALRHE